MNADYICDLIQAATVIAENALKCHDKKFRHGGLFGEESFIVAIQRIRVININEEEAVYNAGEIKQITKSWERLRQAIIAHTAMAGQTEHNLKLSYGVTLYRWPFDGNDDPAAINRLALKSLFEYCRQLAFCVYPHEMDRIGFYYNRIVLDLPNARPLKTKAEQTAEGIENALDEIKAETSEAKEFARIAAARKIKTLNAQSKGGKKGARIQKLERGTDTTRDKIVKGAYDEIYDENGNRKDVKAEYIFPLYEGKFKNAKGEPNMKEAAIKKAVQRLWKKKHPGKKKK